MSAHAFPPPPNPAPPSSGTRVPDRSALPPWRQGRVGWSLAHFAIGIAIAIIALFGLVIVLAMAGWTDAQMDAAEGAVGAGFFFLILPTAIIGWICFAYGRATRSRRWAALLAIAGGGWLVSLAIALQASD